MDVEPLIGDADSVADLEQLLLSRSGLPGPRANLELAAAFADAVAARGLGPAEWTVLRRWLAVPPSAADPRAEYLPVCALQALGAAYFSAIPDGQDEVLTALREAAVDPRWRVRESTAMGLQSLGEVDLVAYTSIVRDWAADPSPLVRRAVLAALAHPPILKSRDAALMALEVAAGVLDSYSAAPAIARKANDYQVLRRGLEYAPSVVVAAVPDEGFAWLSTLAASSDADVRRIVKTNLGKARLAARYPARVAEVLACLSR